MASTLRFKLLAIGGISLTIVISALGYFWNSAYVDRDKYSWTEIFLPALATLCALVEAMSACGSFKRYCCTTVDYIVQNVIASVLLFSGVLYLILTIRANNASDCKGQMMCQNFVLKTSAAVIAMCVGIGCYGLGIYVNGATPNPKSKEDENIENENQTKEESSSSEISDGDAAIARDIVKFKLDHTGKSDHVDLARDLLEFDSPVRSVSVAERHVVILLETGEVLTVGGNYMDQLGHNSAGTKRPEKVLGMDDRKIVQISARGFHTLVLDENGVVLSWGLNIYAQTGHPSKNNVTVKRPRVVQSLIGMKVVQIAAGVYHSVALVEDGSVYFCGWVGEAKVEVFTEARILCGPKLSFVKGFKQVQSLSGVPVNYIAAGYFTSFAVSVSGRVYSLDSNADHELEINDDRLIDAQEVPGTENLRVVSIAAGSSHTCLLTVDGSLYTMGRGRGLLGHGTDSAVPRPCKVLQFGAEVTQVYCGSNYTVFRCNGKYYGSGVNNRGQMIQDGQKYYNVPTLLNIPESYNNVFPGFSFTVFGALSKTPDHRVSETRIRTIDNGLITQLCRLVDQPESEGYNAVISLLGQRAVWNASFLDDSGCCTPERHGVVIEQAEKTISRLSNVKIPRLQQAIKNQLKYLLRLDTSPVLFPESLRYTVLIPLFPVFFEQEGLVDGSLYPLPMLYGYKLNELNTCGNDIVVNWVYTSPIDFLTRFISVYKRLLLQAIECCCRIDDEKKFMIELQCLIVLSALNSRNKTAKRISHHAFSIPSLTDKLDYFNEFVDWLISKRKKNADEATVFSYCNYPFVFDGPAKSLLLKEDIRFQQYMTFKASRAHNHDLPLDEDENPDHALDLNHVLHVCVARETIISDLMSLLIQLDRNELKKPLLVSFINEEAADYGGVKKELFLLFFREILGDNTILTAYESNQVWFCEGACPKKSLLLGKMCGLAIYNSVVINAPFPLALFKKLLGEQCDMTDVKDLEPGMARILEYILEYEGEDFEDVFCLCYEICRKEDLRWVPIIPGGEHIPVTLENKAEYVEACIRYLFDNSIREQFNEFKRGFDQVSACPILRFFNSSDLQALVIGHDDYDWGELENNCDYDGFGEGHITIQWFWEVFYAMGINEKKKFLLFLTGCDRVPITGLKTIKMSINAANGGDEYLPVAHTCFNILDLPMYSKKTILKRKLLIAIEHNEGFSIV